MVRVCEVYGKQHNMVFSTDTLQTLCKTWNMFVFSNLIESIVPMKPAGSVPTNFVGIVPTKLIGQTTLHLLVTNYTFLYIMVLKVHCIYLS